MASEKFKIQVSGKSCLRDNPDLLASMIKSFKRGSRAALEFAETLESGNINALPPDREVVAAAFKCGISQIPHDGGDTLVWFLGDSLTMTHYGDHSWYLSTLDGQTPGADEGKKYLIADEVFLVVRSLDLRLPNGLPVVFEDVGRSNHLSTNLPTTPTP